MASAAKAPFDLAKASEALFASRRAQFGWLLILALISRISVFGDTNYFNDEYFYFQAGLRLHDGDLPYVDVWDRKGPGLFLTYWLTAFFSRSVVAYQTAALLAAAATAYLANCIAGHFTSRIGAMLGGALYLVLLVFFGGGGGQSPVFYNLAMALAALIVVEALPQLRRGEVPLSLYGAMAAAGFAITFKQTAICESLFLGLFVLWQLRKTSPPRLAAIALGLIAAGAAPMALFASLYAFAGHFPEFWHAMVTANLAKTVNPADDMGRRIGTLTMLLSPALLPALAGVLIRSEPSRNTALIPDRLAAGGHGRRRHRPQFLRTLHLAAVPAGQHRGGAGVGLPPNRPDLRLCCGAVPAAAGAGAGFQTARRLTPGDGRNAGRYPQQQPHAAPAGL